jgi:glucosylceramidase
MTPRRLFPICLPVLIALAAALPAGAAGASTPARAWLTIGDGADLLAEQPPDALGAPAPAAPTTAVDPSRAYQRIEGLGAPIADSSAHLIARSPDRDITGAGEPFSCTLPAGAVATFVLRP